MSKPTCIARVGTQKDRMTNYPELKSDCANCQALCCMALAFDRGEKFAEDKPAGRVCRHLGHGGLCRIHSDLAAQGYQGCVDFDCQGAGQRVVAEVFPGQDWRKQPRLAATVMEAFRRMRKLHELLVLLKATEILDLPGNLRGEADDLVAALTPVHSADLDWLTGLDLARLEKDVRSFLHRLAPHALGLRDQLQALDRGKQAR